MLGGASALTSGVFRWDQWRQWNEEGTSARMPMSFLGALAKSCVASIGTGVGSPLAPELALSLGRSSLDCGCPKWNLVERPKALHRRGGSS